MTSTKLRDTRNDYQRIKVNTAPIVTPPPISEAPTSSAPVVDLFQSTQVTAEQSSSIGSVVEKKKTNYAIPIAVFCGIVAVGGIGLTVLNQPKKDTVPEHITADGWEEEVSGSEVSAAEAARAAADAAAEAEAAADATAVAVDAESAEAPLLTNGSSWTYKVVDYAKPENSYDNVSLVLQQVSDESYTFYKQWLGTNRESATLEYDHQLNLQSGAIASYSPALSYYDFPLYPGKTWSKGSEVLNHKYNTSDYMTFEGRVFEWESVSSPEWSDIKALKIEVEIRTFKNNVEIARDLDVSWYEPEVGRAIKTLDYKWNDAEQSYGEPMRLTYVVNYNRR